MDFPGYRIKSEIGKGGMATVYLAIQESLHRLVALKVMEPALAANESFAERFLKEGRIIARLDHSQIITVYDFGTYKNNLYLSMEYLPGGTLEQKIREGLLLEQVLDIIQIIAKALGYAHSQGVLHRDIKPQNILFRKDGSPVLTDFGIARFIDDTAQLTAPGFTVGSPLYMSPERIMGKKVDARSDLYSLGIVFYQMLTARLPYQADNSIGVALKQCSAPVPVLPRHLLRFQPLLEKLLAKNPQDRFANGDEFLRELNRIRTTRFSHYRLYLPKLRLRQKLPLWVRPLTLANVLSHKRLAIGGLLMAMVPAVAYLGLHWILQPPESPISTPPTFIYEQDSSKLQQRQEDQQQANPIEKLVEEAHQHQQQGDLQKSLTVLERGLEQAPDHAELRRLQEQVQSQLKDRQISAYVEKAQARLQQKHYRESLSLSEQGLALAPDHDGLITLRDEATKALEKQEAITQLLQECDGYFRANRLTTGENNAVNCYRQVLRQDPMNIRAVAGLEQVANRYVIWANAALKRGNRETVKSYLDRLAEVNPAHPELARLSKALSASATPSSDHVARAQFTTGIEAREPVDRLETVIPARNRPLPLYYFTEIRDMKGETVTHLWKYKGAIVSKKSFEIGGNRWRVYSRKDLTPDMTGRWQVFVITSSGQTINSSSFIYNTMNVSEQKESST